MRDLSLQRRFTLLSLFILLAVALPTAGWLTPLFDEQALVRRQFEGTPAALALLQANTALQEHRLHSLLRLSGQAGQEGPRAQAQASAVAQLQALRAALPAQPALLERLDGLDKALQLLAAEVAGEKLAARESFERHGELLRQLDDLNAHTLAGTGLLLGADPATHFLVIAAFQEGKTVLDQLAQLHDLGFAVLKQKGASPLDLNQLAAIKARLEDRARFFAQTLALAQQDQPLPEALTQPLAAAQQAVADAIALTEATFLGMSPDWDVKPEDHSQRLKGFAAAQQRATAALAQAVSQALEARSAQLTRMALGIAAGLLLLVLFLAWRLRAVIRAILRPMDALGRQADAMAAGDLTQALQAQSRNELGQLTHALEGMRARWHELLRQVQGSAQQVHAASQEIRADNLELSNRSETAASRLQEAAARVNELATEVGLTGEATGRAHGMAEEAAAVAAQGGAKVQAVVQTMEAIQQSSHRITDIIGVIDGIAFQTNILALNAAVEAARAGEQGRGFAVVATEVRSLAQRSAEAAREIKQLIGRSAERVESGTAIVHEAGRTMAHIVESVGRVRAVIEEIRVAAQRQGAEIGQVDQAVREVDGLTQRNAAMVEQSAAAAATLAEQADQLSERVARFRL